MFRWKAFLFAAVMIATFSAAADDVANAAAWLTEMQTLAGTDPIAFNYAEECQTLVAGSQKYGCPLSRFPGAALLVCQSSSCTVAGEVSALGEIADAGLPVVPFVPVIYSFVCNTGGGTCNGYVVRWYGPAEGSFFKPTRSGASPLIIAAQKLADSLRQQTCTDMKLYFASWQNSQAIGDWQGVLELSTGRFLTADPTRYPVDPPTSQSRTLKQVCNAICKKDWGQCN